MQTQFIQSQPDHGGGIDAAAARFGGDRADWIDLSTGVNPVPYPLPDFAPADWAALPDRGAQDALIAAARRFWSVPDDAAILATPGASAPIALIPHLVAPGTVRITEPTYNEHGRAFDAAGWRRHSDGARAQIIVHPNNPDGRLWDGVSTATLTVIDESFGDVMPGASLISRAALPGHLVLKSFGKFWGLAGLRLGFVIGDPALVQRLATMLGPWPVSGPALRVGARAFSDPVWAEGTRTRLATDAARLDRLMIARGAALVGGTPLFRLYDAGDARHWQDALARHRIWSRVFPYCDRWLRLGLPAPGDWPRVEAALQDVT